MDFSNDDFDNDPYISKKRKNKKRKRTDFEENSFSFLDKIEPTLQDSLLSQVHNGGEQWKRNKEIPSTLHATNGQKWWMAVIIGFLFFILASPSAFKTSNKLFKCIYFPRSYYDGSTTLFGLFVHMLAFVLIIRIILW